MVSSKRIFSPRFSHHPHRSHEPGDRLVVHHQLAAAVRQPHDLAAYNVDLRFALAGEAE
jgi:hypothetical protein